ncbi:MAG: RNA-binding S4 domain-containing protein [Firmicutes bacterium]|nr:RNA-binding S4 domain-containing protein [Bacillota bacterium]
MRIDKFLKVSRVLKRRTIAQDACAANKVSINGKTAKAGAPLKIGDTVTVNFSAKPFVFKVVKICDHIKADLAHTMYEIIE